jgi:uncharacterized protein (TIGR02246 family)
MRSSQFWFMALVAMSIGFTAPPARAEGPQGDPKDLAAIQKNAEAFIAAFEKGDAAAVAALWAPDGDYTDQSGRTLKGRADLLKALQHAFALNKGMKLRINSASLRFLTPDVAVEDGTTEVIPPDGGPPSSSRFTNIHVKKDGEWRFGSVRTSAAAPSGNYQHLRELEPLLGEWAEDPSKNGSRGEEERLSFTWAEGQSFVVGTFAKSFRGRPLANAKQWIGWDPVAKNVRSWMFDASGAFAEGTWAQDGNRWVIQLHSTFPDAKKGTATFVLTRVDADTLTLQGKGRSVDGNALPDSQVVTLKRTK